jgi:cytochrome c556
MRRMFIVSTSLAIGVSFAAAALAQEMKPEEIIKARQGLMEAVRMQLGPIVAVVKGNAPLSPATAETAETIVGLAHALKGAYGQGTENLPGSHAKAEAFSDPKFLGGYDKLAAAAAKLAMDAKANNIDAVKADLGEVGGACKGCHDNYRVKF